MKTKTLFIFLLLFAGGTTPSRAENWTPVQSVGHTPLADLLTRSERLMHWEHVSGMDDKVEIYRLWEGPLTCGDTLESCPRQRIFIRINTPTGREAYLLPAALGWNNLQVTHSESLFGDFTLFEVQEDIIEKNPVTRRFDRRTRRILFNLHEAYMQRTKETEGDTPHHGRVPCEPPG